MTAINYDALLDEWDGLHFESDPRYLRSIGDNMADAICALRAELAGARRTTDYWKAEHGEANNEIDRLRAALAESERDAEKYRKGFFKTGIDIAAQEKAK